MDKTIKVINELKKEELFEDYAIGGGIAALFYIEPFVTYDLDIFIILPKENKKNFILLSPIFDSLKKRGYKFRGEHIIIEGIPVQFIPTDELEEEAVRTAKEIEYKSVRMKVVSPEYLVAILLRSGRKKDMEKVERLLQQVDINHKKLQSILNRHNLKPK